MERRTKYKTGSELREAIRNNRFNGQTSGHASGYVQANLVVLPKSWAFDFLLFAQRNPKPCPLIEVGDVGKPETVFCAENGDIRTDIPKYLVFKDGEFVEELSSIKEIWRDDFVYFLLGCSFTFEQALLNANLEVRHITENVNVPMYKTNIICNSAGKFSESPMVVSMRPFNSKDVIKAVEITREYPYVHGSPIHIGNPEEIGITDIGNPDFGDSVSIKDGETPVFWACGVTPQLAVTYAKPPIMITHAPGHMFVGDKKDFEYKI